MNSNRKTTEMKDTKVLLSILWVFVTVNFIYEGVLSNMEAGILKELMTGYVGGLHITQGFLLGAAILLEIPFVMIVLSRVLKYRANRWANIIAGTIMAVVQFLSFFVGTPPTLHYIFFSTIEIACLLFIVWYAWKWPKQEA